VDPEVLAVPMEVAAEAAEAVEIATQETADGPSTWVGMKANGTLLRRTLARA